MTTGRINQVTAGQTTRWRASASSWAQTHESRPFVSFFSSTAAARRESSVAPRTIPSLLSTQHSSNDSRVHRTEKFGHETRLPFDRLLSVLLLPLHSFAFLSFPSPRLAARTCLPISLSVGVCLRARARARANHCEQCLYLTPLSLSSLFSSPSYIYDFPLSKKPFTNVYIQERCTLNSYIASSNGEMRDHIHNQKEENNSREIETHTNQKNDK